MAISAQLVNELRKRTGVGMMDCKKALEETGGDIEAAIEYMRKTGQAKADKKAGRIAAEGLILIKTNSNQKFAVIIEVNCETDFVARDENFINFANRIAELALANKVKDVATLAALSFASNKQTVEDVRKELVTKIGENITIRRLGIIETTDAIGTYIHGGRIGVLVEVAGGDEELRKDLAMHIAAANPLVVNPKDVPQEMIEKEREIFHAQAETSGKPNEIVVKMVDGRINKYLEEVSLLGQAFVKDPSVKISKLLQEKSARVNKFIRYEVGEGIEKMVVDFAKEVISQAKGS